MANLDDAVAGMPVGAAIEAGCRGGDRYEAAAAVYTEHVALVAGGVRVVGAGSEKVCSEELFQPRGNQRLRPPPHRHSLRPPPPIRFPPKCRQCERKRRERGGGVRGGEREDEM